MINRAASTQAAAPLATMVRPSPRAPSPASQPVRLRRRADDRNGPTRAHLRRALLALIVMLSCTLGLLAYLSNPAPGPVRWPPSATPDGYVLAIVVLWVWWLTVPAVGSLYAEWRFGPPRLRQPKMADRATKAPGTTMVIFQGGSAPSLN